MKETVVQEFHRLLVRACREGEESARVDQGAYVSKVIDMTDMLVKKIEGKDIFATLDVFRTLVETYSKASVKCLSANKPSTLIYLRHVASTHALFQMMSDIDQATATPSSANEDGRVVMWLSKVPDVFVYFSDEFVEGMYRRNGPSIVHRVKTLVSNSKTNIGTLPTCAVCMETQTCRMQVVFKCSHSICSGCVANIIQLNENRSVCPLCRSPLSSRVHF